MLNGHFYDKQIMIDLKGAACCISSLLLPAHDAEDLGHDLVATPADIPLDLHRFVTCDADWGV